MSSVPSAANDTKRIGTGPVHPDDHFKLAIGYSALSTLVDISDAKRVTAAINDLPTDLVALTIGEAVVLLLDLCPTARFSASGVPLTRRRA